MRLLLTFIKPYKGLTAATVFALLLDVAGALFIPTILAEMINIGATDGGVDHIISTGAIMMAVTLLSGAASLAGSYLCAKLCSNVGRDIRNAIYDSSLAFSDGDFKEFGTGSMITRTLNDVNIIQQALMMGLQILLPVPIMCVMGVTLSFMLDVQMGWIMLAIVVIVVILAALIVWKAAGIFEKLQSYIDRMNVVLRENITGVRVIRAFGRDRHEIKRLDKSFSDYANNAIRVNYLFAGLDSFTFFLMNIAIVLIIWAGGDRVGVHAMQIGDITALIEYSILILFYIMMAQFVALMVPRAIICISRVRAVIEKQPSIRDGQPTEASTREATQAWIGQTDDGRQIVPQPDAATGAMMTLDEMAKARAANDPHPKVACFNHLSFRFPDAEEDTLHDLTFSCRRGQTTAIIGPTGSGKSTVARLMLRLLDATDGRVLLHGRNVKDMTQHELREHIAYVPQKAWLFSGTIADNLRYGNPDATEEEMWHALDIAQSGFVRELPLGLNTRVAQGGTNFSGGQRQRLAIARALTRKADLYIFDDSFSALDFATDAALRKALAVEVKDSAMLIIAQRVSTIVHADQIIVLEDGHLKGRGTHEELMRTCATYQDIARSQMRRRGPRRVRGQSGGRRIRRRSRKGGDPMTQTTETDETRRDEAAARGDCSATDTPRDPIVQADLAPDEEELEVPRDLKRTIRRLWDASREQQWRLYVVGVSLVFYVIITLAGPIYTAYLLDLLWDKIQAAFATGETFTITWMDGGIQTMGLLLLYTVQWVFYSAQTFIMASFAERLNLKLRNQVGAKLTRLPLKYFDAHQPGRIISRVTNDLDKTSEVLQTGLLRLLVAVGNVTGAVIMMFTINVWLTLIFLVFAIGSGGSNEGRGTQDADPGRRTPTQRRHPDRPRGGGLFRTRDHPRVQPGGFQLTPHPRGHAGSGRHDAPRRFHHERNQPGHPPDHPLLAGVHRGAGRILPRRGQPDDRHVPGLLPVHQPGLGTADRDVVHDQQPAVGLGFGGARVRHPGRGRDRTRSRRAGAGGRANQRPRRLRARQVRIRPGSSADEGRFVHGRTRAPHRHCRFDRRRQDHADQSAHAVLRDRRRPHPPRRRGYAPYGPYGPAPPFRHGAAGRLAVRRHHRREHRVRPTGRHPRADHRGRQDGTRRLLRAHPAQRL